MGACCGVPKEWDGQRHEDQLPKWARIITLEEAINHPEVVQEVIACAQMGFSGLKDVEGEPLLDWVVGKTKTMKEAPEGDESRLEKSRQELETFYQFFNQSANDKFVLDPKLYIECKFCM